MDATTSSSAVLDLVSQSKRIKIIQALMNHRRTSAEESGLSFSELLKRSGVDDKGTFNYHLHQLRGYFIEKRGDEYRLSAAGEVVAGALIAGIYHGEAVEVPTEHVCSVCNADVVVAIESGKAEIRCREGHRGKEGHLGMTTPLPPGIADGRTGREVLELTVRHYHQMVELALNGTCIQCYGPVEGNFEEIEVQNNTGYAYRAHCDSCGHLHRAPAMALAVQQPAVERLCRENGIKVRETPAWELPFIEPEENVEIHPSEPFRVEVTVQLGGEVIQITFSRSGDVVSLSK